MIRERTIRIEGRGVEVATVTFDGLDELAAWYPANASLKTSPGVMRCLLHGDATLVPRADRMLDAVETIVFEADSKAVTERAVTGSLADVPAYLAGVPMAMRRRVKREAPAPLAIVVDVTTSGGIGSSVIERRGVATLALLRKLQAAGHPVELFIGMAMQPVAGQTRTTVMSAVRMDTQPLDLSRTCWALTDPAFQREIMFGTAYALARTPEERQGYIAWPWAGKRWHGDAAAQREAYGALLGLDPARAVVIPSVHLSRNPEFENDAAAVRWVNAEYAKAVELAKEEY